MRSSREGRNARAMTKVAEGDGEISCSRSGRNGGMYTIIGNKPTREPDVPGLSCTVPGPSSSSLRAPGMRPSLFPPVSTVRGRIVKPVKVRRR